MNIIIQCLTVDRSSSLTRSLALVGIYKINRDSVANGAREKNGSMEIWKENEQLEFKRSTAELKEGVMSICAMLNKHGRGQLYFGVRDNGVPLGFDITENTLREISQAIAAHLDPPIYPTVNKVFISEKPCVLVEFSGEARPYNAYGRTYIRVADADRQMSIAEVEKYILKKHEKLNPWDSRVSKETAEIVDEKILQSYLNKAIAVSRIGYQYDNRDSILGKLDLLEDGKLKNAALVMFNSKPTLETQMAVFAGKEKITFIDIYAEQGNIYQLMESSLNYVRKNIRYRAEFDGNIERTEIPELPIDAIREAIVNSYCHRDYQSQSNNAIIIFSDRVEIINPGEFPDGRAPNDFFDGTLSSRPRNRLLAQLMYYTKDIERFGRGLKLIVEECARAEIKVEFQARKGFVAVVFHRPELRYENAPKESNVTRVIALSKSEYAALLLITKNTSVTPIEIAEMIGKSHKRVSRYLEYFQKERLIRLVGSQDARHWEINANIEFSPRL
ncbi:MAG: putative DNA binding domain-containing protein [Deltaproteobacteria bacterium]|jgi:ATP-dependent DNA helicase RecG|nr:putative DNA binding domain-containing protein [Deltaproteobacteria bacterium]